MKSVLIFTSHYSPHLGGIERFTDSFANSLITQNISVTIVTNNTEKIIQYEQHGNKEVFRLDCICLLNGRFPIPKINKKYFALMKNLKQKKFDFCLIQARFYVLSLFAAIFSFRNNIQTIILDHGTGHFTINNFFFDLVGHIYEHIITFFLKCFVKKFAGVSKSCCLWLKHFHINTKMVIYNGVDVSALQKGAKLSDKKFRPQKEIEVVIISYVGRFVREKGLMKVIDAFNLIKNKYKGLYLLVAGDGELKDILLQECEKEKRVIYVGKLNFNDVSKLYVDSDILLYPSEYPEGFPTTILEAAALNVCVIASNAGGTSELIIDDTYGILLQDVTVEKISQGLEKMLLNDNYKKNCAKNAFRRVNNSFEWNIIAKKFISDFLNNKEDDYEKN